MITHRALRFWREHGARDLVLVASEHVLDRVPTNVGLGFWMRYNTLKNVLRFDRRSVADPLAVRWIDPADLSLLPKYVPFDRVARLGHVVGGEWDRSEKRLEDTPVYRGLCQRFEDGRAWEDTAYVRESAEAFNSGNGYFGCTSVEELLEVRCTYLDRLFHRIKEDGYKPQSELDVTSVDTNRFTPTRSRLLTNEVGVNIGRDGTLLLNSGYHRATMARILSLDRIPAQVIVRHTDWQRIRQELAWSANADTPPESAPDYRSHPDMVDLLAEQRTETSRPGTPADSSVFD